jgi:hypothetical protein
MDAIHFRRGIHNMSLLNYELEVPLTEDKNQPGSPDVTTIQRLWWASIKLIEEWRAKDQAPVRLALEMRVFRNSNMLLPPQSGNQWTVAIEVATFNTPFEEYMRGCQLLTDKWVELAPKGTTLPRPHWAKTFQGLTIHNKPIVDYLKTEGFFVNGTNHIELFKQIRREINPDPRNMFSNKFLDQIFDLEFKKVGEEAEEEGKGR